MASASLCCGASHPFIAVLVRCYQMHAVSGHFKCLDRHVLDTSQRSNSVNMKSSSLGDNRYVAADDVYLYVWYMSGALPALLTPTAFPSFFTDAGHAASFGKARVDEQSLQLRAAIVSSCIVALSSLLTDVVYANGWRGKGYKRSLSVTNNYKLRCRLAFPRSRFFRVSLQSIELSDFFSPTLLDMYRAIIVLACIFFPFD